MCLAEVSSDAGESAVCHQPGQQDPWLKLGVRTWGKWVICWVIFNAVLLFPLGILGMLALLSGQPDTLDNVCR